MTAFDARRVESLLQGTTLGRPLRVVAETGSTNDDAMEAARAGVAHGATFVAEAQTRGRGRRGASWLSPPGANLLFSTLLRPNLDVRRAGSLTLAVGLAVRDVISRRVDQRVLVKWPNDIVVGGRKIAGILLESQLTGDNVSAVIVGVGVNVGMTDAPPEIAEVATSLALLGANDLSRESLLAELLTEIERRLRVHERYGLSSCLEDLRRHDALCGRRVQVDALEGVARRISDGGALVVEDAEGEHEVMAGHVTLL